MSRPARMAECHPDRPHHTHGLCNTCQVRAYRAANREKVNAWGRASKQRRNARDPDYNRRQHAARREQSAVTVRRYQMLNWYGLSVEEYEERLAQQQGVCAICLRPEKATYRALIRRLAVDHVHGTSPPIVRGLLCAACNRAIGNFGDDPERLKRALAYLERAG